MRNSLTIWCQYGLMRPVARIAQSVEQGIENPRVLGSIPSPGTIFRETSLTAGFLLSDVWTLHRTRSIIRSASSAHPCGAVASDVQLRCAGCPSPGTIFRETSLIAGFLLSDVWTLHRTRSIIRSASSAHPCGAVASDVQSRCAGCPSPGTIFRETSLTAGFLLSSVWTLHRTRSIIRSASSAHPCGAVASDVQSRCAGCPSPSTLFRETSLSAGGITRILANIVIQTLSIF